jgi:hypothetical protein
VIRARCWRGRSRLELVAPQELGKLSEVRGHAPRLIGGEHAGVARHLRVVAEVEPPDRLASGVLDPIRLGVLGDGPGGGNRRGVGIAGDCAASEGISMAGYHATPAACWAWNLVA